MATKIDPCKICYQYPNACPAMCIKKHNYCSELDGDVEVIRKNNNGVQKSKGVFRNDVTKNGIKRSTCNTRYMWTVQKRNNY